jgi:alkylation response protein AidB-like acyl-CoA dehydrogenase
VSGRLRRSSIVNSVTLRPCGPAVCELGLLTLPFDADVGGSGGTFLACVVACEEVARYSATAALYPGTTVATQVRQATV